MEARFEYLEIHFGVLEAPFISLHMVELLVVQGTSRLENHEYHQDGE
jgi:hypothetical protein